MTETIYNFKSIHTSDPSALKWSRACFLSSPLIDPSNLWNKTLKYCIVTDSKLLKGIKTKYEKAALLLIRPGGTYR